MRRSLLSQLDHLAHARPTAPAIVDHSSANPSAMPTVTWTGLHRSVGALGRRLRDELEPGDTLILALPNQTAFHVVLLGALTAGLRVFPVSPGLTECELTLAAERTGAVAVVGPAQVCDALKHHAHLRLTPEDLPTPGQAAGQLPGGDDSPSAFRQGGELLLHSSGTTGLPKIVRRPIATLDAVGHNCAQAIGLTGEDRVLAVAPLHHSYGIEHGLLMPLAAGATVILPANTDPVTILQTLADQHITTLPAVPFIYEAIAMALGKSEGGSLRAETAGGTSGETSGGADLRRAYSAGGVLPRRVARALRDRLGWRIGQVFGSTEVGSVTYGEASDEGESPHVGRAMAGVDLRILDRDGPDVDRPLGPGEEGLLAVRAPSMLAGYIGEDASPSPDGFFRTGDLARLDRCGRLMMTGRSSLLINVGGKKVNPLEVEAVLREHPLVRDAVVLPLVVTQTVSRLRAIVVPDPAAGDRLDAAQLRGFTRQRLTGYKVPRQFELRSALPRSSTGKVLRQALESPC